jgi:hypothetical protein
MQRCSIFVSKSNFVFWRTRGVLRVLIESTISRRNLLPHPLSSWSEKFFTFLIKFWIYREKNSHFFMNYEISYFKNSIQKHNCLHEMSEWFCWEMSVFELVNIACPRYCQMSCGQNYKPSHRVASHCITSRRVI